MKTKKSLILYLVSLCILCIGYVLTRYVFFDLHGMKQWPLVLFVCGIVVIGISFITKAKQVPLFTALSYIAGFAIGTVFQIDGLDSSGGKTNNLWIIWTVVFVCFTIAAILSDRFAASKKN